MRTLSTIALLAVSAAAVRLTSLVESETQRINPLETSLWEARVQGSDTKTAKELLALKEVNALESIKKTAEYKALMSGSSDPAIDWSSDTALWLIETYDQDSPKNWTLNKEEAFKAYEDKPHMMKQLESVCYPNKLAVGDEVLANVFDLIADDFGRKGQIEYLELFTFIMNGCAGIDLGEALQNYYCQQEENKNEHGCREESEDELEDVSEEDIQTSTGSSDSGTSDGSTSPDSATGTDTSESGSEEKASPSTTASEETASSTTASEETSTTATASDETATSTETSDSGSD